MSGALFNPDSSLTPDQEGLLRIALSSNAANKSSPRQSMQGALADTHHPSDPGQQSSVSMANGNGLFTSPTQKTPGSGQLDSFEDSPFLDYDNLDDGNFDWDTNGDQLFGDLPGGELNDDNSELHDKRKASTDDNDEDEGSSKRREGDDKGGKKTPQKPGRKPLTGEPTTKRKAQNRAAQRAFRERKERHLKDLETKVEDLEKTSEATNHENGRLRATVDKLQMELKEYRKRLSLNASGAGYSPPQSATQPRGSYSNANSGGDFSFAFPKFGDLPGSFMSNGSIAKTTSPTQSGQRSVSSSNVIPPALPRQQSSGSNKVASPTSLNNVSPEISTGNGVFQSPTTGFNGNNYGELSSLFSPSILENASRSNSTDYISFHGSNAPSATGTVRNGSINSNASQMPAANLRQGSTASITNSPASTMSHALESSCGTTPEASAESPKNRQGSENPLNTIDEDPNTLTDPGATINYLKSPSADIPSFDWMAQQNGGQFDPVLFGDYRDPQDNILNNSFGDFFNNAYPLNDFSTPYNTNDSLSQPPKKDFMKEIGVTPNGNPQDEKVAADTKQFMTCDKLWDRVQNSNNSNLGEIEMDDLCSQLKSKAKCSGKGAVIAQKDVDEILGPAPQQTNDPFKMFS